MTDQERAELKALAEGAKGWSNCNQAWLDTSEDTACATVGHITEDGETYPLAVIDCEQYYSGDSLLVAKYYAAANPASVLALLADLEEEKTRTSHYKDVAEQINSELELVRAEKEIVRGFVTERDGIIAKMQAELERLRELAATAEKWRGIASARHGDGRTVAEIQNEARAEEREACARVCEEHPDGMNMLGGAFVACAAAIRARNEKGGA